LAGQVAKGNTKLATIDVPGWELITIVLFSSVHPEVLMVRRSNERTDKDFTVQEVQHIMASEGGELTKVELCIEVIWAIAFSAALAWAIIVGKATAFHLLLPMVAEYLFCLPLVSLGYADEAKGRRTPSFQLSQVPAGGWLPMKLKKATAQKRWLI
jgi:hypothetical protein